MELIETPPLPPWNETEDRQRRDIPITLIGAGPGKKHLWSMQEIALYLGAYTKRFMAWVRTQKVEKLIKL